MDAGGTRVEIEIKLRVASVQEGLDRVALLPAELSEAPRFEEATERAGLGDEARAEDPFGLGKREPAPARDSPDGDFPSARIAP